MDCLSAKPSPMGDLFSNMLPINKDLCRCPNYRRSRLCILCSAKKVDTFSKASKSPHCNHGSSRAVYQQSSDHYSICHPEHLQQICKEHYFCSMTTMHIRRGDREPQLRIRQRLVNKNMNNMINCV